jgi:tape measure domain-containing protein
VAESVVTLRVDASGATRALQGVQNRTNALERSFGGLKAAIGGVGLGLLARQAVKTSINFDKLNLRLGLLTKATGDFSAAQKIATDGQKLFGLSATEALEGVTNITARLKPLGVSLEDIRTTFIGFNTAAKLGGANAQEASNAFRQLAQALGSGRLAGDEFRSVSEQIPLILKPLADELDVDVGKLKELAAQGKLTSDVVIRALRQLGKQGGEDLKAILDNDPTQVFKNLSNEAENLSRAVGEQLTPAILPVIRALTELTKASVEFVNSPIGKTAAIFAAIAFAAKGVAVILPAVALGLQKIAFAGGLATLALNAIPFVAVATGIGAIVTQLIKQRQEQDKVTQAIKDGEVAQLRALEADLGIKMAKEIAIINNSNDKRTIAAAERRLALLKEQMKPIKERLDTVIKENAVEKEKNKTTQQNKEIQEEINKLIKDNLKKAIAYEQAEMDAVGAKGKLIDQLSDQKALAQAAVDGNLEQVQTQQEINALVAIHGEGLRDIITKYIEGTNALKKQKDEADELKDKFDQIGEAIESSIKDNLRDAITGAQSFGQAMTNVLNRIRDKIIDAQLDRLVGGFSDAFSAGARGGQRKGIGGFLGGLIGGLFANGGRPPVGKASIVGERGPELFVPKVAGTIIPNNAIGGGDNTTNMVTVNVDASGSSVAGNSADAQQLGAVIGAAIQAQLIKEKRPGGLLTR